MKTNHTSERTSSRIESLDALKAFSIVLVVFCHSVLLSKETLMGNICMSMAWAAVPCFMMVSGALMHQAKSFSFKKYFGKLGKIYIVLSVWRLIYLIVNSKLTEQSYSLADVFQYLFLLKDLDGVDTGVMWYMIAYLIVMLMYPTTYFLFQSKTGQKILVMLGLVAGVSGILIPSGNWLISKVASFLGTGEISLSGINRAMPMTNYENMIFYYVVGAFLYEYRDIVTDKLKGKRFLSIVAVLVGTAGLMTVKYLDVGTWRWQNTYLSHGYQHLLTVVLSLGVYLFFTNYQFDRLYHYGAILFGRFTLGIYYMHYVMLTACQVVIYPLLTDFYSFRINYTKTLVITCICAALTYLLRKIPVINNLVK